MNDYNTAYGRPSARAGAMDASIDAGLRRYMIGIYNHMLIAMVITGAVSLGGFQLLFPGGQATELARTLFGTPLRWVVMLAPLGVVFYLSFRVFKMSPAAARAWFYLYAGLIGLSLTTIFIAYTGVSIARTFFVTASAFGALSLWGYTTKRDLTGLGSFLIMGLFGVLIAMVVNFFLHSAALEFAISAIGVLVFAGLTAYDTQQLKGSYYQVAGNDTLAGQMSILGALRLYLDFLNLFLFLLRFMGGRQ